MVRVRSITKCQLKCVFVCEVNITKAIIWGFMIDPSNKWPNRLHYLRKCSTGARSFRPPDQPQSAPAAFRESVSLLSSKLQKGFKLVSLNLYTTVHFRGLHSSLAFLRSLIVFPLIRTLISRIEFSYVHDNLICKNSILKK